MRDVFKGKTGVGVVIVAVLLIFSYLQFSKKWQSVSALGRTIERQESEIDELRTAVERVQTLKSLRTDLSLKLFGERAVLASASSSAGRTSGILTGEILSAARKTNVEFASMELGPAGATLRFWGRYADVARFLSVAEMTFDRVERFSVEKSKNGGVLLSLTVSGSLR